MKPSWIDVTRNQREELAQYVPAAEWRVLSRSELPSVFPNSFREKLDLALLISAPTSTGGTYLVLSANRFDSKDRAVDIEPLGLIVHSCGPSSWAVFVHHGDWDGRTEILPMQFWEKLSESGIGDYYLANPPEGRCQGSIDELPKGHRGAFNAVIQNIRMRVDSSK